MRAPNLVDSLKVWAKIGLLSFGGPAGQIALMHREVVEQRRWCEEKDFLAALNFCMLLPGPEAMQLATYIGWRHHGVRGGLMAGLLFLLPGALLIAALASLYLLYGSLSWGEALFTGIKGAVLMIVVQALWRLSRKALKDPVHWVIAALAFTALFLFDLSYPLVVLAAALLGLAFCSNKTVSGPASPPATPPLSQSVKTLILWLGLWSLPFLLILATNSEDTIYAGLGLFFSKLAVVTFGGAYAVLSYMAQAVVETKGWLSAGEMLDSLGLAETTPGPLILVTEFVAFLAAAKSAGGSLWAGLLGALVALWVTFTPCFLWIFLGGPYLARINASPILRKALEGVTAAVVGGILNLSLWFALKVLLPGLEARWSGPVRLWAQTEPLLDYRAALLTLFAAVLFFVLKQGLLRGLGLTALAALALHYFGF